MKELFKNKSFTLLFTGSLVSEMGNVLFGFVAGLYVQDITGGNSIYLALFMALGAAVRIAVSPLAGVLVDRWDKVKIIYLTDFLRGLIFLGVAYIFFGNVSNQEAINILLVVTVLSGVIGAFFGPAVTSAVPEIVGMDQVQAANGATSIIQSVTMILGVILGAAAFSLFKFEVALLINGISFMLSGFSEMFIKSKFKEDVPHEENKTMMGDFKVGFSYLLKKEGLLTLMIFSLFLNFAFSPLFSVGVPFLLRTELARGPWEIAWTNIAFGVSMLVAGIVVGGMVIKNMTKAIRWNLFLLSSSFLFISLIIYMVTEGIIGYWVFYVLFIIGNIMLAFFMIGTNIPLQTGMVKAISPELRGRVFSTIGAISGGAVPIAIFLGGILINYTSVAFLGLVCSILMLFPTIGFLTNKKVKNLLDGYSEDANGGIQETV